MTFGRHIQNARRSLGLTQAELAARLAVDKQSISNWECERSTPWPKERERVLSMLLQAQIQRAQLRTRVLDRIKWEDD
ncbi:MAG: helix-turn-helix transcriptional regulator [Bradyrhizobium sp.]|nr:helix-turn-helix transcriptional regulator [Bradyrhizobium sp.]